jgi:hypothetical protein
MQNGPDPHSFVHLFGVERAPSAPLRKVGKWASRNAQRLHQTENLTLLLVVEAEADLLL